jgi:hypothetical protein
MTAPFHEERVGHQEHSKANQTEGPGAGERQAKPVIAERKAQGPLGEQRHERALGTGLAGCGEQDRGVRAPQSLATSLGEGADERQQEG